MDTSFASLLRRYRVEAGLSQEALARRSGISVPAVSALERGLRRAPRRQTIRALAQALALTPHQVTALDQSVQRRRRPRPSPPPPPPGVPRYATSLVGRDTDLAVLTYLLRQLDVRMLTLTGPAGVGKTHLAAAVAIAAAPTFRDGAVWADLAPVREAELVAPAIAAPLGVRATGTLAADLAALLAGRELLLALDHLEQVPPAGALLVYLLDECPGLRLLSTSSAPLRARGERVYPVPPLTVPPPGEQRVEAISASPAVQLFLQRARATIPALQLTGATAPLIAAACRHLDGLPLAIEVVAALARLLPPRTMLAHLSGSAPHATVRDGRQPGARGDPPTGDGWTRPDPPQIVRDAIAWSYDLLEPGEQALLRRLAAAGAGGWTIDAAAHVARIAQRATAATLLGALADRCLLRRLPTSAGQARFGMPEVVREYALQQLEAHPDEAADARDRHQSWYLEPARTSGAPLA